MHCKIKRDYYQGPKRDHIPYIPGTIYLLVALRTFALAFVSNESLLKRRVFIKTGLQEIFINIFYRSQESIFFLTCTK